MKKRINLFLFLIIIVFIGALNEYHKTCFLPPVSIHSWRQADGASFALNYHKEGMHFLHPQIHNLEADDHTSGAGISEAPILYYLVALFYNIFGFNDFIFRFTNLFLIYLSLFYLFKGLVRLLENPYWAAFISIIPFTSTIFCYYANSYIPDFTALAFMILAGYQFLLFIEHNRKLNIVLFFILATLAGLLKVTSLTPIIALNALFLLSFFIKRIRQVLKYPLIWVIGFLSTYLIIISWYLFAHHYNEIHQINYFANEIHPAFYYTRELFYLTLNTIWDKWNLQYFNRWMFYFFPFAFICTFLSFRKNNLFKLYLLIVLTGSIIYFILWFDKFNSHDYYIAPLFPILILSSIGLSLTVKQFVTSKKIYSLIGIVLFLLIIYPIISSSKLTRERYTPGKYAFHDYEKYRTLGEMMKSRGISRFDKVISANDKTFSVSLYLMDFKGWSARGVVLTPTNTLKLIEKGASFLILKGDEAVENYVIKDLLHDEFIHYEDFHVFDLRQIEISDSLFNFDSIMCGAENVISDFNMMKTSHPLIFTKNGDCKTSEKAYSGNSSVKLNKIKSFGFSMTLPTIKPNDSLIISIWKLGPPNVGELILNNEKGECLLRNKCKTTINKQNQWQKIEWKYKVPDQFTGDKIGLFIYQPDKELAYFDDLKIIKISP